MPINDAASLLDLVLNGIKKLRTPLFSNWKAL
jgi:hypothetical protein